jgi:hypothetical protein
LTALGYKSEIAETRLTKDPETEAPAEPKAEVAAKPDPKQETPSPDAAPSEPAAAEVAKPVAPADSAPTAEATKAEPPKPNTPKPAPRKPQPKKSLSLYHHRVTNEAGETVEVENLEYWHFPSRGQKGFKPGGKSGGRGKPAFKGKRGKGPQPRRNAPKSSKPPTQKQVENSPFAALAALKNPKKD